MTTGFPTTSVNSAQVVLASTSGQRTIPAETASPGWHVVDEFPLVRTVSARLDLLGQVSASGLTMRARLFDLTTRQVVPSLYATITATEETRAKSGQRTLTGGHIYQVQIEVTGGTGDNKFGLVQQAALSN